MFRHSDNSDSIYSRRRRNGSHVEWYFTNGRNRIVCIRRLYNKRYANGSHKQYVQLYGNHNGQQLYGSNINRFNNSECDLITDG